MTRYTRLDRTVMLYTAGDFVHNNPLWVWDLSLVEEEMKLTNSEPAEPCTRNGGTFHYCVPHDALSHLSPEVMWSEFCHGSLHSLHFTSSNSGYLSPLFDEVLKFALSLLMFYGQNGLLLL